MCPEPAYPINGGGSFRSAALLHYLADRYALDAIFFRETGANDPAVAVPSGLLRASMTIDLPLHSKSRSHRAKRNLRRFVRGVPPLVDRFSGMELRMVPFLSGKRYEVAVVEHSWCMPYLPVLKRVAERCILDMHNIESVLHERCSRTEPVLQAAVHRRFSDVSRELERAWLPLFDLVMTTSEEDRATALAIAPGAKVAVYPNTLPWRDLPDSQAKTPAPRIVFSANFEYHPNRTAVDWFVRNVWTAVKSRHPEVTLLLAGRNDHAIRRIVEGDSSITCTGEVDDTFPYIAAATIAIAPLQSGSGTRLKILEAFAAGVPVVSTPIGAEGLPVRTGEHLLIAGSAEAFASSISALLGSLETRVRLARAARTRYEEEFTWQAGWGVLDRLGI